MTYKVEDPHADHPGYDARNCPCSHKVTARGPYGQIYRAGFACLATGGHCLPGGMCDERRRRWEEQTAREAEFEAIRFQSIHRSTNDYQYRHS